MAFFLFLHFVAAILFRSRLRSLLSSSVDVDNPEGPGVGGGTLPVVDPSDSRLILGCLAAGGAGSVVAGSVGADLVLARTPAPLPPAPRLEAVIRLEADVNLETKKYLTCKRCVY